MEKHTACPLCQVAGAAVPMPAYAANYLVRCGRCGLVYAERIPAVAELVQHYAGYKRIDTVSPITIRRYRELLQGFAGYSKTNNILDIGAGNGFFLKEAVLAGWNAYGTEFTDVAIEYCTQKGAQMFQGELAEAPFPAASFDVLTGFEVIEHVPDPAAVMAAAFRLLRPGGVLYLTTPNFNALSRRRLGPRWSVVGYPEHLMYFTPRTLSRMARNCGFRTHGLRTEGMTTLVAARSDAGDAVVRPDRATVELLRQKTESRPLWKLAKRTVNTLLNASRTGDTIKIELVRPAA